MFIGTADERNLRPHAFYQVHRITGKMVATASYEAVVGSTKVLEMTVLPENGMTANIDCAGILKLRNSDIELRKGETDIGRKNTRVRLVFRVHVPQGNGKVVSLQTASIPIECSQRSAQELPQVESYNITACSVNGREELVLSGSNFLPESKVIFLEKGPDGKLLWEEEAEMNRSKSNEHTIILEVPEYSNKKITRPVQAFFYVSNGRRKRSPTQCFKYLPVLFKDEPCPDILLCRFPSPPSAQTGAFTELLNFSPEEGEMEVLPSHQTGSFHCLQPAKLDSNGFPDLPMDQSPYYPSSQDCHYEGEFAGLTPSQYDCLPPYFEMGDEIMAHQHLLPIILGDPPPFHAPHAKSAQSPVPWSPQPPDSFHGSVFPYMSRSPPCPFNEQSALSNQPSPSCLPASASVLRSLEFNGSQQDKEAIEHSHDMGVSRSAVQDACSSRQLDNCAKAPFNTILLPFEPAEQLPAYQAPAPVFSSTSHDLKQPSPRVPVESQQGILPEPSPKVDSVSLCNREEEECAVEVYTKDDQLAEANEMMQEKDGYSSPFHSIQIEGITLEEVSEIIGHDLNHFPEMGCSREES